MLKGPICFRRNRPTYVGLPTYATQQYYLVRKRVQNRAYKESTIVPLVRVIIVHLGHHEGANGLALHVFRVSGVHHGGT